jgi:NAD(P)-dependent dehydrogenase (short-subunit alcohol dehydrogenase family)
MKEAAAHVPDGGKIITIVTALLAAFTGFYTSYAGSKAPVEHFTRYFFYSTPPINSLLLTTRILGV